MATDQYEKHRGTHEADEFLDRGREQRKLGERRGREVDGDATHPVERETGHKAESNVGEDQTSGDG